AGRSVPDGRDRASRGRPAPHGRSSRSRSPELFPVRRVLGLSSALVPCAAAHPTQGGYPMHASIIARIFGLIAVIGLVAGCANTIRGVGQDTANAVDATQQAGRNVGSAAQY